MCYFWVCFCRLIFLVIGCIFLLLCTPHNFWLDATYYKFYILGYSMYLYAKPLNILEFCSGSVKLLANIRCFWVLPLSSGRQTTAPFNLEIILLHYWGHTLLGSLSVPCVYQFSLLWLMGTGSIPSPVWVRRMVASIPFQPGCFLTFVHPSSLSWKPEGNPLPISGVCLLSAGPPLCNCVLSCSVLWIIVALTSLNFQLCAQLGETAGSAWLPALWVAA